MMANIEMIVFIKRLETLDDGLLLFYEIILNNIKWMIFQDICI